MLVIYLNEEMKQRWRDLGNQCKSYHECVITLRKSSIKLSRTTNKTTKLPHRHFYQEEWNCATFKFPSEKKKTKRINHKTPVVYSQPSLQACGHGADRAEAGKTLRKWSEGSKGLGKFNAKSSPETETNSAHSKIINISQELVV